jgi:hypothetical protein
MGSGSSQPPSIFEKKSRLFAKPGTVLTQSEERRFILVEDTV